VKRGRDKRGKYQRKKEGRGKKQEEMGKSKEKREVNRLNRCKIGKN
jgi:hypothetical protein